MPDYKPLDFRDSLNQSIEQSDSSFLHGDLLWDFKDENLLLIQYSSMKHIRNNKSLERRNGVAANNI